MVSLVVVMVVVAGAAAETETATLVRWEERLATDKLAPETNQNSANDHADDRNAHASNNTDQNGENNVRGQLTEQLRPSVLALLCQMFRVGTVVMVLVRVSVAVGALSAHHTGAAVHLHLGQLGDNDGTPLADDGCAFLVVLFRGHGSVLGSGLLNLANQKLVLGKFDEVDADVGKTVDKD